MKDTIKLIDIRIRSLNIRLEELDKYNITKFIEEEYLSCQARIDELECLKEQIQDERCH